MKLNDKVTNLITIDSPEPFTIDLSPLGSNHPPALDIIALPGVKGVFLRELDIVPQNAAHALITLKSPDLSHQLQILAPFTRLIVSAGSLTRAALSFLFAASTCPHAVELLTPSTMKCQFPGDFQLVLAFLEQAGLLLRGKLARTIAILLIVVSTAIAPALGDGDNDDDDLDSDRHSIPARAVPLTSLHP